MKRDRLLAGFFRRSLQVCSRLSPFFFAPLSRLSSVFFLLPRSPHALWTTLVARISLKKRKPFIFVYIFKYRKILRSSKRPDGNDGIDEERKEEDEKREEAGIKTGKKGLAHHPK